MNLTVRIPDEVASRISADGGDPVRPGGIVMITKYQHWETSDALATTVDYLLTGNPAEDTKLASTRLFRRFQAVESLAEDDREAIIKVIDAMVIKHQTRQMVDGINN